MVDTEKIGAMLVRQGLLTQDQVDEVLAAQATSRTPFGRLACERFGLDKRKLYEALADQMRPSLLLVDLGMTPIDARAMGRIERELAWGNRCLPLRMVPGTITCATTSKHLPRAIALMERLGFRGFDFVLTDDAAITDAILSRYGLGYMDRGAPDHCRVA